MSSRRITHRARIRTMLLSLAVLALLAASLDLVGLSGASFFDVSANPGNTFTAGTLSHVNSRDGEVIIDAIDLRPGQSRSQTVTLTGQGDVGAVYTIGRHSFVDTPAAPGLSSALALRIDNVTAGTTLFSGAVATFSSVPAGTIRPGTSGVYRFTLSYPLAAADPQLQSAAMRLCVKFTGVTP